MLVHAVGLAPTKDHRPPDLQSGAIATQPHMQIKIRCAKKQMKAERTMSRIHFETHFSRGWRSLGLSRSTEIVIRLKAPAFISRKNKRYFDCQKTKGAGI